MDGTALDEDSHEDYENDSHQHAGPPELLQRKNKYINKKYNKYLSLKHDLAHCERFV